MNTAISAEQIERHIHNDIEACTVLLNLLEQEKEALKNRDIDILADVVEKKVAPLNHLEESARQRARWANIGEDEQLSEVWRNMMQELGESSIQENWQKLKELSEACREQNEVNGKILSRSKQVYGRLLEIMRGQSAAPSLYTAAGNATATRSSFKVDEA